MGFGLVAALGYFAFRGATEDPPLAALVGFCAIAALVEGGIVSAAQWRVLRRRAPAIAWPAWAIATILPAFVAYVAGFTLFPPLGARQQWLLVGLLGAAMAATLGVGQWLLLRRHVARAGAWVPASLVGWTLGLGVSVAALVLVPDGAPPVAFVAAGLLGGVGMGLVVGAITAWAFVRLRPRVSSSADAVGTR